MQSASHRCTLSLHESRRFSEALKRALGSLKGSPQVLLKAVPNALKALADLQEAQQHLIREDPALAGEKMTAAAGYLQELAKELHEARRQLGVEGDKTATLLARERSVLLGARLPIRVEEQFARIHLGTVLSKLVRKARDAADKALPADTPVLREIREAGLKDLEKILGEGVLARVRAAEQFAEAAGERLVPAPKPGKKPTVVALAENTLRQAIDSNIAQFGAVAATQVKFLLPVVKKLGARMPPLQPPPVLKQSIQRGSEPLPQRSLRGLIDAVGLLENPEVRHVPQVR
jgi:hypothetical protein